MNAFINSLTIKNTVTENGALSNSSTGSALLDQFSKASTYVNVSRPQSDVEIDMVAIWDENPELAMRILFYWRMITRKNKALCWR